MNVLPKSTIEDAVEKPCYPFPYRIPQCHKVKRFISEIGVRGKVLKGCVLPLLRCLAKHKRAPQRAQMPALRLVEVKVWLKNRVFFPTPYPYILEPALSEAQRNRM